MVKLSKNVLDTHLMKLEVFIIEYSQKLLLLFLEFENLYDWLKLNVTFKKLKRSKIYCQEHHYFLEIVNFQTLRQS